MAKRVVLVLFFFLLCRVIGRGQQATTVGIHTWEKMASTVSSGEWAIARMIDGSEKIVQALDSK